MKNKLMILFLIAPSLINTADPTSYEEGKRQETIETINKAAQKINQTPEEFVLRFNWNAIKNKSFPIADYFQSDLHHQLYAIARKNRETRRRALESLQEEFKAETPAYITTFVNEQIERASKPTLTEKIQGWFRR